MVTKAEREQAVGRSITEAIEFASGHGHVVGPFVRRPQRFVAAEAECARCHGKIVVDTKGVIGIPLTCV
jgi:hypothetical protein